MLQSEPSQFQLRFDEKDDANACQQDGNAGIGRGNGGKCPQNADLGLKFLHGRASCLSFHAVIYPITTLPRSGQFSGCGGTPFYMLPI